MVPTYDALATMNTNFQSIMNTSNYNMATATHMTALDAQRVFVGILLALNLVLFAATRWLAQGKMCAERTAQWLAERTESQEDAIQALQRSLDAKRELVSGLELERQGHREAQRHVRDAVATAERRHSKAMLRGDNLQKKLDASKDVRKNWFPLDSEFLGPGATKRAKLKQLQHAQCALFARYLEIDEMRHKLYRTISQRTTTGETTTVPKLRRSLRIAAMG
jgi:hypothetical protein